MDNSNRSVVIQIDQLNFDYGTKSVLKNISLKIQQGERVALVGPSGCGKSTLLRHIVSQAQQNVGYCPQDNQLINNLSAYNNIYAGRLEEFGLFKNLLNLIRPSTTQWAEIHTLAKRLQIDALLKNSPEQLSGGQQKRVAIARALYQQRSCFVGDEPFAGLDKELAERVLSVIQENARTLIVSLHDRDVAVSQFTRLVVMRHGQIIMDTPTRDLSGESLDQIFNQTLSAEQD